MSNPVIDFSMADVTDATPYDDDASVPRDSAPLSCEVCGTSLMYKGRGRKPRYCDEHKPTRSTASTPRAPRGSAKVAQAVATLESGYDIVSAGFLMFGLTDSASMFDAMRPKLAESNVRALEASPTLTAALTKVGATGGAFAFVLAHIAVAVPVVIVARAEIAQRYPKTAKRESQPQPVAADDEIIPNAAYFGA